MNHPRVLGVLAGTDMPGHQLRAWAESAHAILAADAGADHLRAVGITPQWVIGDMDSVQGKHFESELHHDQSQDSTDCDKLLLKAIELGYQSITLASIEGDQLDHMLATLNSSIRHPITVRVALRTGVGWVMTSASRVEVETVLGRRISLLPLTSCRGVALEGVEWPLDGNELSPAGAVSVSNRATRPLVIASLAEGAALLYVERVPMEPPLW